MADNIATLDGISEVEVAPGHWKGRAFWTSEYSDLDAEATTDTVDLDGLPSTAVNIVGKIVPIVEYAGGAVSAATCSMGTRGGDVDGVVTAVDVFTGATLGTAQGTAGVLAGVVASSPVTTTLALTVTTTTADVDECTAGKVGAVVWYDRFEAND